MSRHSFRLFLCAVALLGLSGLGACGDEEAIRFSGEGFPDECTVGVSPGNEGSCPAGDGFAQFCTPSDFGNNVCLNVCDGATALGAAEGGIGDFCETDSQCDTGSTCDNDTVGGSSCQCVAGETELPEPVTCDPVNTDPGSVPFGGACDASADCADEMPCVDCSCV